MALYSNEEICIRWRANVKSKSCSVFDGPFFYYGVFAGPLLFALIAGTKKWPTQWSCPCLVGPLFSYFVRVARVWGPYRRRRRRRTWTLPVAGGVYNPINENEQGTCSSRRIEKGNMRSRDGRRTAAARWSRRIKIIIKTTRKKKKKKSKQASKKEKKRQQTISNVYQLMAGQGHVHFQSTWLALVAVHGSALFSDDSRWPGPSLASPHRPLALAEAPARRLSRDGRCCCPSNEPHWPRATS